MREAAGRAQRFGGAVFASVIRPTDHPARPDDYLPLGAFWRRLGLRAEFTWRNIGASKESVKQLQVWGCEL